MIGLGFATTTLMWALGYLAFMPTGPEPSGEIGLWGRTAGPRHSAGSSPGVWSARSSAGVWDGPDQRGSQPSGRGQPLRTGRGRIGARQRHRVGRRASSWCRRCSAASAPRSDAASLLPTVARCRIAPASFFSLVAAGTVFVLIVTGGLVTGMEAGLAVPDWPNSFGHNMLLYPLSEMKGGIFYEHAHRLYGMLVGVTAITLVVMVFRYDERGWVRWVAGITFFMVCVQGLMGGLRVTGEFTTSQTEVEPSTTFAVAHGVFGQLTFAAFVTLATVSSGRWRDTASPAVRIPQEDGDRHWSSMLLAALLIQLFLGRCYRHFATPALDGAPAPVPPGWAMYGHLTFSLVALVTALFAGLRAKARRADRRPHGPGSRSNCESLGRHSIHPRRARIPRDGTSPDHGNPDLGTHSDLGASGERSVASGCRRRVLVAIRRFEKRQNQATELSRTPPPPWAESRCPPVCMTDVKADARPTSPYADQLLTPQRSVRYSVIHATSRKCQYIAR